MNEPRVNFATTAFGHNSVSFSPRRQGLSKVHHESIMPIALANRFSVSLRLDKGYIYKNSNTKPEDIHIIETTSSEHNTSNLLPLVHN